LLGHFQKLAMDVLPFADAQLGEEILLARLAKLVASGFGLEVVEKIPQLHPTEEVGVGIEPLGVSEVGFLLPLGGALPRVLDLKGSRDDQHVGQTLLAARFNDHATDARVGGKAGELAADGCELAILIHGAQLEERLVAIANRLGPRRIEKRKLID